LLDSINTLPLGIFELPAAEKPIPSGCYSNAAVQREKFQKKSLSLLPVMKERQPKKQYYPGS